jgi:P pilus assembly chaperone PapD
MKGKKNIIIQILFVLASCEALANIAISPTLLELREDSLIGEIVLENQGPEAKLFEASLKKWTQKDNADIFEATTDIIVLPLSANILANKKQKFRIILRKPALPEAQDNYRLFFSETRKFISVKNGLSFLLNINLPVFSNGKNLNNTLGVNWSVKQTQNKSVGELMLSNNGSKTFVVTSFKLSGRSEYSDNNMRYVLPGASVVLNIPLKEVKSDAIHIKYVISGKSESVDLKIIPLKSLKNAK